MFYVWLQQLDTLKCWKCIRLSPKPVWGGPVKESECFWQCSMIFEHTGVLVWKWYVVQTSFSNMSGNTFSLPSWHLSASAEPADGNAFNSDRSSSGCFWNWKNVVWDKSTHWEVSHCIFWLKWKHFELKKWIRNRHRNIHCITDVNKVKVAAAFQTLLSCSPGPFSKTFVSLNTRWGHVVWNQGCSF